MSVLKQEFSILDKDSLEIIKTFISKEELYDYVCRNYNAKIGLICKRTLCIEMVLILK